MVLLQAIKAQSTDMPIFKILHIMFFGQTFFVLFDHGNTQFFSRTGCL
ncbi:hypothetical protein AtDm6_3341 [Acetobacter tropicalis]|uniref:Uncharacterized protein n=1 Tax=Acetobacter tropicalis TaxID=104102 RepID=A0A094ZEC3_9PROT|nr:hypothetical protein AtDm6_3341 [Acetobacter tropicalis]